jgi:hypothetical protein
MKKLLLALAFATAIAAPVQAYAECIVADPSPTPLNVRTAPYGRIVGVLSNGQVVFILDGSIDSGEPYTENYFRQLVVAIVATPVFLGGHRQAGSVVHLAQRSPI